MPLPLLVDRDIGTDIAHHLKPRRSPCERMDDIQPGSASPHRTGKPQTQPSRSGAAMLWSFSPVGLNLGPLIGLKSC
jgi:hypothetical protein